MRKCCTARHCRLHASAATLIELRCSLVCIALSHPLRLMRHLRRHLRHSAAMLYTATEGNAADHAVGKATGSSEYCSMRAALHRYNLARMRSLLLLQRNCGRFAKRAPNHWRGPSVTRGARPAGTPCAAAGRPRHTAGPACWYPGCCRSSAGPSLAQHRHACAINDAAARNRRHMTATEVKCVS
jgi:hypothetical protein